MICYVYWCHACNELVIRHRKTKQSYCDTTGKDVKLVFIKKIEVDNEQEKEISDIIQIKTNLGKGYTMTIEPHLLNHLLNFKRKKLINTISLIWASTNFAGALVGLIFTLLGVEQRIALYSLISAIFCLLGQYLFFHKEVEYVKE